jgi:hypothetical protein
MTSRRRTAPVVMVCPDAGWNKALTVGGAKLRGCRFRQYSVHNRHGGSDDVC